MTPSSQYFRAVALDIDGTLVEDTLAPDVLAALREVRLQGLTVVLVTGRVLRDVRERFPELMDQAAAIVAENGAIVATSDGLRALSHPVDGALVSRLRERGVPCRRGQVLLACSSSEELEVMRAIRSVGGDCQLVRNRDALMVLPAGVSKASGLEEALRELGLSVHNTIAVGDAENDHSLLNACELGVAVANAVDGLKIQADMVLDAPNGHGVTALLRGGIVAGRERVHSRRWQLTLGEDDEGNAVCLPSSQLNVIITGGSGTGKSYLAGLVAEQLLDLGYRLAVLDPEGDHLGLEHLTDAVVIEAAEVAHLPGVVSALLACSSVVFDLSSVEDPPTEEACVAMLSACVEAHRQQSGMPQWVLLDEAHQQVGRNHPTMAALDPAGKGYLLVTWQPGALSAEAVAGADVVIGVGANAADTAFIDLAAAVGSIPRATLASALTRSAGRAVLVDRQRPGQAVTFRVARRSTPHFRHEHKYGNVGVGAGRRFYFRTLPDVLTDQTAINLAELRAVIAGAEQGVLRHHCPGRDFSRWIAEVFHDERLAASVRAIEETVSETSPDSIVELARMHLTALLGPGAR